MAEAIGALDGYDVATDKASENIHHLLKSHYDNKAGLLARREWAIVDVVPYLRANTVEEAIFTLIVAGHINHDMIANDFPEADLDVKKEAVEQALYSALNVLLRHHSTPDLERIRALYMPRRMDALEDTAEAVEEVIVELQAGAAARAQRAQK
jgi:hypothetical protein